LKSKLIVLLALLLLFIPTYFAIGYYIAAQNAPMDVKVVSHMTLTDTDGAVYNFERSQGSSDDLTDNMIGFFLEMNDSSKEVSALPEPLVGTDCFNVAFTAYNNESLFRYYFTDNPDEAYFVDNEGKAHRIPGEYSQRFILSDYAKSLFPASNVPVLTVRDEVCEPQTMLWQYKNVLGDYKTVASIDNVGSVVPSYRIIGGKLQLDFDIEPDFLSVKIVERGVEIFNDLYENIGQVNLVQETTVSITLVAKWYDSETRASNGEAVYNFYGEVQAQPVFYLGQNEIEPGEFVVLTGLNIEKAEDITFTSSPDIDFEPVFFKDGKYYRALIPISIYLPEILALPNSGTTGATVNYTFTVSCSGITQDITLIVKDKRFKPQTINISMDIENVKRNAAVLEAFDKAMSNTYTSRLEEKLFSGAFLRAANKDSGIRTGFGIYRTIRSSGTQYRHEGVDFLVDPAAKAVAVNGGKVIYVGEQVVSGKIVVIDHGFGLKSTYCHLSAINVAEGDIVKAGDVIATVGSTGFTEEVMLHYGLSVFDVPVCPYSLWENGVVMTEID